MKRELPYVNVTVAVKPHNLSKLQDFILSLEEEYFAPPVAVAEAEKPSTAVTKAELLNLTNQKVSRTYVDEAASKKNKEALKAYLASKNAPNVSELPEERFVEYYELLTSL